MTPPGIRIDVDAPSELMLMYLLVTPFFIELPINYQALSIHPMALLPASAFTFYTTADLLTRPLPTPTHHRYTQFVIGDEPPTPTTSVARPTTTVVASTIDSVTTASAAVDSVPTVTPVSDSVPTLHPNLALVPTLPIVLDTGASYSLTSFASDFLPVNQAPYGLIRSAALSNSVAKALAPADPYTLITGDVSVDLSSPDTIIDSDSFAKVHFDVREFGTASLTFIFRPNLDLIKVFVTPTQVDWIHWVPLPRLTPTESYFHIFGRDYLQAFTLFHLIPIWIYCLLHFAVTLED